MPNLSIAKAVSPDLQALRDELATLHDIFASLNNGNIRAGEWQRAQRVLDYVDGKIKPLEARVAELVGEINEGSEFNREAMGATEPAIPSKEAH
jgi:hypothetical protein